jgi:hypothetical protein
MLAPMPESFLQWSELFSYLVTIIGLPLEKMDKQRRRLWRSWEDYMREWCKRKDFREALPELLVGEDPDFARHILQLAALKQDAGPPELSSGNTAPGR